MFIPYKTDVPFTDFPYSNILIIICTVLFSFVAPFLNESTINSLILSNWNISGLIGHLFLHAGFWHLIGNMLFLWVFGNAICSRFGNIKFLIFYFILGFIAAASHLIIDGNPAVGASGAINGILGSFLVLYPKNKVSLFVWFFFLFSPKTIYMPSIILIVIWFIFDILGAIQGQGQVAFMAHIGGLIGGVIITFLAL